MGAVLLAVSNALWSAWDQGWTYDEPFHLRWSERFLASRVIERDSAERLNSKTPILLPNVMAQKASAALQGPGPRGARFAARLPSVLWLLGLLACVFVVARAAFGMRAALIAAILAGLDPNLAAHGSLATVDVSYACAHLAAVGLAVAFLRSPGVGRGLALGAAVGLAFAAKFSAFLLLPCLLVTALAVPRPSRRPWAGLLAAVGAAWLVLCAAYLFDRIGVPAGQPSWRSAPLRWAAAAAPAVPLPLPLAFAEGLDASLAAERSEWNGVLLGRRFPHGAWFYFLVLWALKTPLLLLAAQSVGLVRIARDRPLARHPVVLVLLANLAIVLLYFSLLFRAHIGYRFVLAALPFAYLLAAAGLATLPLTGAVHWAARALLVIAVVENIQYFGNPLSFSNGAVQPKRDAFRLMADSNLNWGQNRERLTRLLKQAGMETTQLEPVQLLPGHVTLDVNAVAGVWDFEQHRWVREHLQPQAHVGHTHLAYEVDNETFGRYMQEARLLPGGRVPAEVCPADLPRASHAIGARVPLAVQRPPAAGDGWAVCVTAPRGGDFGLRVGDGYAWLGAFSAEGTCTPRLLAPGQVAWYRLEPGEHALCLEEVPNRRVWIPYALKGTWLVRGRRMDLGLRPIVLTATAPPSPAGSTPRRWSPSRAASGPAS